MIECVILLPLRFSYKAALQLINVDHPLWSEIVSNLADVYRKKVYEGEATNEEEKEKRREAYRGGGEGERREEKRSEAKLILFV